MKQSVLDRLIQTKGRPDESGDLGAPSRDDSIELLKARVLRDLEWLLNTRQSGDPASEPWSEVAKSIYNYGLPDFASMHAEAADTPTRLRKAIEREIELFEPRLTNVRVSARDASDRTLGFVIEATLMLDPDPERVEFDTVLEIDSGQFSLKTDA